MNTAVFEGSLESLASWNRPRSDEELRMFIQTHHESLRGEGEEIE